MPLVSYREYARMQGIKLSSLQDRIKRGTIPESCIVRVEGKHPKINSELADVEFAARRSHIGAQSDAIQRPNAYRPPPPATSVRAETVTEAPAVGAQNVIDEMFGPDPVRRAPGVLDKKVAPVPKDKIVVKEINGEQVEVTEVPNTGADGFERYRSAKASSETMRARILELELAEMEGRLVDIKDVKKEIQHICTAVREGLLNVPAKIAPELLSCTDIVEMETKLYKEINLALDGLSRLLDARADSK